MKNNTKSRIGSILEIEKSLLENPTHVYFASDFQTSIQLSSFPCKVVMVSKPLLKVSFNRSEH